MTAHWQNKFFYLCFQFYRAMHVVQSAILLSYVIRPSVRLYLFVCLSVMLKYRKHGLEMN